jgi:hypothetical protein
VIELNKPNDDLSNIESAADPSSWATLFESILSPEARSKRPFYTPFQYNRPAGALNPPQLLGEFSSEGPTYATSQFGDFDLINLVQKKAADLARRVQFESLRDEWLASLGPTSDLEEIAMVWPYQRIIGMGYPAVPLILQELRERPHHWFWALRAITGENPVPPTARGNIEEMAKYWLQWGAENGFSTDEPARTATR